jgi:hypothetical protein
MACCVLIALLIATVRRRLTRGRTRTTPVRSSPYPPVNVAQDTTRVVESGSSTRFPGTVSRNA